jgi:hypothetical protein
MTLEDFCAELRKTQRDWHIFNAYGRRIRRLPPNETECPYLAVGWEIQSQLKDPLIEQIWDAADDRPNHHPKIRAALLEACGIPEVLA